MNEPRGSLLLVLVSVVLMAIGGTDPAFGQAVVTDFFNPTSPDRQPGMPLENAPIERGHGRWKATAGMTFGDGGNATGHENSEFAGIRFVPVEHQRSAIVVVETDIYPGSEGWAGVGFAGEDLGPLPSKGELWVKLHHLGKVTVYADGARLKLYKESHPNPAFVQGMNRIRLSYNRRSNTARAWLNDIELPLDDLSETDFTPSINTIAFHLWKSEAQGSDAPGGEAPKVIDDPLMGGITGAIEESFLGESFTLVKGSSVRRKDGPLNGVTVQYYSSEPEQWQATSAVGFGQNYATNRLQTAPADPVVAVLPFDPRDAYGFAVSSVEAIVKPVSATWVAIGLAGPPGQEFVRFEQGGQLWARLFNTGVLQVLAQGTEHVLFDDSVIDPELLYLGVKITLAFDRVNVAAAVWVNDEPVALTQSLAATGYVPAIAFGGFQAYRDGGFSGTNQFAIDDFAIRVSSPIPPLTIAKSPSSTIAVEGWRLSMSCGAADGVAPYSYRWQSDTGEGWNPWEDLTEGVDGYYQTNQPTLIVLYPDETNERDHQCVATDSNFGGSEALSATASLQVRDAAVGDRFSNGPGQVMGDPLDGTSPDFGDGEWWAEEGTVFGIDSITNAVTNPASDKIVGKLEVPDAIAATYQSLSVQAELTIGEADWVGVGFAYPSPYGLMASGELWAMVTSGGRVKVYAHAQAYTLFDQVVFTPEELEESIHLLVEHNDQENKARVWVNHEDILEIDLDGLDPPYVPPLSAVGFQASLYSDFTEPGVVMVDDFALTGDDEVPAPTMAVNPQSQQVGLGFDPQLTCGATGGVPPYSYSWERYNGFAGWLELEEGHPFGGTTTTTLTVSDFDLSLEGSYRCTVRDGRAEPARVSSASATLTTELPNFNVEFEYGWGFFMTATLVSDGTPAGYLTVDVPYNLHFMAATVSNQAGVPPGAAVAPDLDVPVQIWAQCHAPSDTEGPWSLLGATDIQFPEGITTDWFTATVEVPAECIPIDPINPEDGQKWIIASLFIDINAESDPGSPDGYPNDIFLARPVLAEADSLWDNRRVRRNWIPVISTVSLQEVFREGEETHSILFKEFDSGLDLPGTALYPASWTNVTHQSGEMMLQLNVPIGQSPDNVIADPYEPYVAWSTETEGDPIAVMVRYRKNGYDVIDDELYFGFTTHPPPTPPITYPVVFGPPPTGGGDSTNLLPQEGFGDYRVAVWERPGGPFQDPFVNVADDGVGTIETPELTGGTPPGTETHVYLGYLKACQGHDPPGEGACMSGYPWRDFWIDYVAVWGQGTGGGEPSDPVDYSAIELVVQDLNGWITLPEVVPLDEEYRVCVVVDADQGDPPQPGDVRVFHQKDPGGELFEYPATFVEPLPGGEFVYCPQDDGAPVTWMAIDVGEYEHKGWVNGLDDPDWTNDTKTRVVSTSCPIPDVDLP